MDKYFSYIRVSTALQRERETSTIQIDAITKWAEVSNIQIADFFLDEGISGTLLHRPALSELITALENNDSVKGVLIYRIDRLSRDLYIQEHLIRKFKEIGKNIISISEKDLCGDDPARVAFRQMLGVFSELEKNYITCRMSAGREKKARTGGYSGGRPPFAYERTSEGLIINPEKAEIVQRIFNLKKKGCGLRELARLLNEDNIPSCTGKKWHAITIKKILANKLYHGFYQYGEHTTYREDLHIVKSAV